VNSKLKVVSAFVMLVNAYTCAAGPVVGLTPFTAGTPARAAEVNGNFTAVKTAVDDNHQRITALENQITQLQTQLTNLIAINQYLSLQTVNGNNTVRFTGVNVQVVNGTGSTETSNGVGNLLIGYDEIRAPAITAMQCSLGVDPVAFTVVTNEPQCTAAGGTWAINHKSGSHYLVIGSGNNYSRWGGAVIGLTNASNYDYASVTGGTASIASNLYATVSGGVSNRASGRYAAVAGGQSNDASGAAASVVGGVNNEATFDGSSVSGGENNLASAASASVSGGRFNTASGNGSSVTGGQRNVASGTRSTVSGGGNGTVAGGNTADMDYSAILGGVGQNTSAASQTIPALP
jgi:hypothetical protein